MTRELIEQALLTLEGGDLLCELKAASLLRAALEAMQMSQTAVAYFDVGVNEKIGAIRFLPHQGPALKSGDMLYTGQSSNVAMSDVELSLLTTKGAKAWAGVDPQSLRDGAYLADTHAWKKVMADLVKLAQNSECRHETTHRGGVLWEICDDCGAKWADDRGGKPAYSEPEEITAALKLLDGTAEPVDTIAQLSAEVVDLTKVAVQLAHEKNSLV